MKRRSRLKGIDMKFFIVVTVSLLVGVLTSLYVASDGISSVFDRIKSPAVVCTIGNPCAGKLTVLPEIVISRSGKEVYNGACSGCHLVGAAVAPKFGDASAWSGRIDKGLVTLTTHVIEGYNAMPAKGLCMDCSEEEIANAVKYIVDSL